MDEKQLFLADVDRFIEENERAIVADIAALVAVRSVEGAPAPGAPFGQAPRKALDTVLDIARRMGLAVQDGGGYLGWAEITGRERGHLATITHVDVVPEGEGWDGDAFTLREKDGWLIGRGVCDDKGPSILCLYLAKFFAGRETLRYGLRVLLGCNEENGMDDLPYYLARNESPLFCFSPDGEFPVCNGEKGVYSGNFLSPVLQGNLVECSGGIASNVVPDRAYCLLRGDASRLSGTGRVRVSVENGLVRLDAAGIGGHAAMPEGSINAIGLLVDYILDNKLYGAQERDFFLLLRKLHSNTDGSGVGIACRDDIFEPLTCIGGMVSFKEGRLRQNINVRYPLAITGSELTARLQKAAAEYGAVLEEEVAIEPYHIAADSPTIKALLAAYGEVTGREAKTYTMGGGTYARHFKNAVCFGPEIPGEELPAFAGPIHGANEGIRLGAVKEALKTYIYAVQLLQQVDFEQ